MKVIARGIGACGCVIRTREYQTRCALLQSSWGNTVIIKLRTLEVLGEFCASPDISYVLLRGGHRVSLNKGHFLARYARLATGGVFLTRRGLQVEA